MKILFLESFYGGSHKDFALAIKKMSSHDITLLTLPARHWKWRQGGSALAFLSLMDEKNLKFSDFDSLIVTGLTDLNLLRSLSPLPPVLLYLHETQFHYPLGKGETMDFHYGLKDFTNMLAADRVIFNSYYHGDTFFAEANRFFRRMPDYKPLSYLKNLEKDWTVIYPGFAEVPFKIKNRHKTPVILWNHRWEHDKNPEAFYIFLQSLEKRDCNYRLILLGERFSRYPPCFDRIMGEFSQKIICHDYAPDRDSYCEYLSQSDYVISTSLQENFGISVVEAIAAGAIPLLPRRLSYTEILDSGFHDLLYGNDNELTELFINLKKNEHNEIWRKKLRHSVDRFTRDKSVILLDQLCANMAQ